MQDLQTFIRSYESEFPSSVWRITDQVPRDYFTSALALEVEHQKAPPVLIFENIEDVDWPVVTGLFSDRERIAWALGTTSDRLHDLWLDASTRLIPPELINEGICQEVVYTGDDVDLGMLPLMKHYLQDADRYLTSGVIVAKDPDIGTGNLSYARLQYKGPRKFGMSMHSRGHMWDYYRRAELKGESIEIAIVVGGHPALLIGAASRVPINVDEYDVAGALLKEPLKVVQARTVDLQVPADSELVIEGKIEAGTREAEGPFSEYTGYATGRSTDNVFIPSAITHRKEPWFLDICPGAAKDHLLLSRVQREAETLRRLRETLPNIKDIHFPNSGTHFHCYLSIDVQKPGDARQAGLLLLGLDHYVKLAIIVDGDINVHDESEVMWAVATRMQPGEDVIVVNGVNCNVLDPSARDGVSSKMIIDATKGEGWDLEKCSFPEEIQSLAREFVLGRVK
jgi:UbiD family decarboxylase